MRKKFDFHYKKYQFITETLILFYSDINNQQKFKDRFTIFHKKISDFQLLRSNDLNLTISKNLDTYINMYLRWIDDICKVNTELFDIHKHIIPEFIDINRDNQIEILTYEENKNNTKKNGRKKTFFCKSVKNFFRTWTQRIQRYL